MGVYAANYAVSLGFPGKHAACLSSSTAAAAYERFCTSRPCLARDAAPLLTLEVTVDVRRLIQVMHLPDIRDDYLWRRRRCDVSLQTTSDESIHFCRQLRRDNLCRWVLHPKASVKNIVKKYQGLGRGCHKMPLAADGETKRPPNNFQHIGRKMYNCISASSQ